MTELFAADDLVLKRIAKSIDFTSPRQAIGFTMREAGRGDSTLSRGRQGADRAARHGPTRAASWSRRAVSAAPTS